MSENTPLEVGSIVKNSDDKEISPRSVFVNIYDLVEQNDYVYWAGLGIYHSGVQVYGREFAYGGHEYDAPGVFATAPRQIPGGHARYRESIYMGPTHLSEAQVMEVIQELGAQKFKGNRYHLLQKNCNSFSEDLCKLLTGNAMPAYVNRMAQMAVKLNCLVPQGWLPPLQPPTADDDVLLFKR